MGDSFALLGAVCVTSLTKILNVSILVQLCIAAAASVEASLLGFISAVAAAAQALACLNLH